VKWFYILTPPEQLIMMVLNHADGPVFIHDLITIGKWHGHSKQSTITALDMLGKRGLVESPTLHCVQPSPKGRFRRGKTGTG